MDCGRRVITSLKDGVVVMASEVGVLEFRSERGPARKAGFSPGKMFLIDTRQGRIIDDAELKQKIAAERPYREWLNTHMSRTCRSASGQARSTNRIMKRFLLRQQLFGYTHEDLRILMAPMAQSGRRGNRVHGNRHASGRPVGSGAVAVQLLQATFCPGDESAARCDSRRTRHVDGARRSGRSATS